MIDSNLRQLLAYYRNRPRVTVGSRRSVVDPLSIADYYDGAAIGVALGAHPSYHMNQGYWSRETRSIEDACCDLMRLIVQGMQDSVQVGDARPPRLLDVACGLGGTLAFLAAAFPGVDLHGINITQRQLDLCRRHVPQCRLSLMDATSLQFPDKYFDYVTCIEAAFQFRTRERFLREAVRVLRKGGVLAMTDVLVTPETHALEHMFAQHHPAENQLSGLDAYNELVLRVGFSKCRLTDITESGARSYYRFRMNALDRSWQSGGMSFARMLDQMEELWLLQSILQAQLICIASK